LELSGCDAKFGYGVKMKKPQVVKREFQDIDKEIESLEMKKKKMMRQSDMVFCPICKKYYSSEKCGQGPEMSGPILEAWYITCPKGHTWDDK
jgi:hypothetical protein